MRAAVVAFVSLLPFGAIASPADDVAARFVEVLRRDDLGVLTQAVDPTQPDSRAWEELREIIDRYDCITITRYETTQVSLTDDHVALRIDLRGTAALKAAWRPERPLPRTWHIEARRDGALWRIRNAITEERRVALEMFAAASTEVADRVFRTANDADLPDLARAYANELSAAGRTERMEHVLSLAQGLGDVPTEIAVRRDYAISLAGNPAPMLAMARSAEELARASGSPDDLVVALMTVGLAHLVSGRHTDARADYAEAAGMIEAVDDPVTAMKCLHMVISINVDDPVASLATNDRLAGLAHRYAWEEGEEVALFNAAQLQSDLGNYDVVRALTLQLIDLGERRGNRRFLAAARYNLATLEQRESHHEQAAIHFRAALEMAAGDERLTVWLLGQLAATAIDRGQLDEAEEWLHKQAAMQPMADEPRAFILMNRARIDLLRGHAESALAEAREGLAILAHDPPATFPVRAQLLRVLTHALEALDRTDDAIVELGNAVAAIEERQDQLSADALGLTAFLHDYADLYVELVEALVAAGRIDEAFRVAEAMKARGLREAIATSHVDRSVSMSLEERSREAALDARVVEVNRALLAARQSAAPTGVIERQLADARRELNAFRAENRTRHPAVGRRRVDTELRPELPAGSGQLALVEYVVAEKQVIAFVVTRDAAISAVCLPIARTRLERDAHELAELLAARSPEYGKHAARMYAALLEPLADSLRAKATLAIVPDGILWNVPFHALVASDGRPLVDHHPIFYAHSLTLLRHASEMRPEARARLFALGNPSTHAATRSTVRAVFRDVALGPLADAETEVRSLGAMYPRGESRVYVGADASERAFKSEAGGYRVIHLAAHAIVDDRAPMYSSIVLAAGADDDGLLEARELADLPLNAELAVLSACRTARGKVEAGEGVIGLSWALFAAGCPTTVVSQWDAQSAATAKLMVEFHRRLRAGDTTAIALRRAQLAVRAMPRYRHPFYWAPFIAIGAGDRRN